MRLLRLDLEKYGAFEGRSLVFRPDARLHVVFGPNEAGKSSALSAVGDLLFGFGQRTDHAFRHAMGDLRLGGLIADREGRALAFRRRKGTKATLIDADDKPLRDDLLIPYLGALGRETFDRAFGLTADALRKGGEELRQADGEAGASLFTAASGLRGLKDIRRSFDEEADALFRPQAQKRRFNEEFSAFETARREVAANELGQSDWKRLNEAIEGLEARHADLAARLRETRIERARIERLGRARRAVAAVDETRRALAALGEGPDLSPSAASALAGALDAADAAAEVSRRAAAALVAAEADVAAIAPDAAALAAAEEIEAAARGSGAYATLKTDLPRVGREAAEKEAALAGLAERLGFGDAAAVEAARPTDAARADLKALIADGRERARASADRARSMAAERERLSALEDGRGEAEPIDPRPLRESLAALGPRLRSLDRRDLAAAEADAEARAIAEAAGRLSPAVPDLDALAARPWPGAEAIARFRTEAEGLGAEEARLADIRARDAAEKRRVEADLAALAAGGPIASRETIRSARDRRDAAWGEVRAHAFGSASLDPERLASAVSALEGATAEADRLADRAAEDAGRAARQTELSRRLADLDGALETADARLAALAVRRATHEAGWRDAWAAAGVVPASPAEMEAWRRDAAGLIERRERNGRRLADVAALDAGEAGLRPELRALAAAAGLDDVAAAGARGLAARVEERLAGLDDRWREAAKAAAAVGELRRRLAALEAEEAAARRAAETHAARWSSAARAAGLGPDVSLAAAAAALEAWDEAPGLIAERDDRLRRVRGMTRDCETFSGRVAAIVAAVAPDLADLAPDAAARRLNDRLTSARAADARRAEAARRLDEAKTAAAGAAERSAEATAAAQRLSAGLAEGSDLRALIATVETREQLSARLAERRAQLLDAGERDDEATLRAELDGFDPDAAPASIEALGAEEARLVAEDRQVYAELSAERARRDGLGGAGAEQAAARQRAAGAALAQTAREWSVLKIASLLIGASVERASAVDRSPVLERAGALFVRLTGGAFDGFAQDFEKDEPALVARRSGGERVAVAGLSEGTRDQFYLALRLAALEDYAARAEPAPFIGDDLFASFDDARTANGLRALAEVGASVQPILFTHHRAVVDAARKTLGEAVDVVEIEAVSR